MLSDDNFLDILIFGEPVKFELNAAVPYTKPDVPDVYYYSCSILSNSFQLTILNYS